MTTIPTNIKDIRDTMRKDTGVDGDAQRISQMVWMLLLKIIEPCIYYPLYIYSL